MEMKLLLICALCLVVARGWRPPRSCGIVFHAQTDEDCTLGHEIMPAANRFSMLTIGWTFDERSGKCVKAGVCHYNLGADKNTYATLGACRSYCLPHPEPELY